MSSFAWPCPGCASRRAVTDPRLFCRDGCGDEHRRAQLLEDRAMRRIPGLGLNYGPRGDIVRGLVRRVRELQRDPAAASPDRRSLVGALASRLPLAMPAYPKVITLGSPRGPSPRATKHSRFIVIGWRSLSTGAHRAKPVRVAAALDPEQERWRGELAHGWRRASASESIEVRQHSAGAKASFLATCRLAQARSEWQAFRAGAPATAVFPPRIACASRVARALSALAVLCARAVRLDQCASCDCR